MAHGVHTALTDWSWEAKPAEGSPAALRQSGAMLAGSLIVGAAVNRLGKAAKDGDKASPLTPAQLEGARRHGVAPEWIKPDGDIRWPANDGFARPPRTVTLQPGTKMDRYGGWNDEKGDFRDPGDFLAKPGTAFDQRALPSVKRGGLFSEYEVIKPIPDVQFRKAAPWFGEPGGGRRYKLPLKVEEAIKEKIIRKIEP